MIDKSFIELIYHLALLWFICLWTKICDKKLWNGMKNGRKLMITNEQSIGKGLNTLILGASVSIGNLPWLKEWQNNSGIDFLRGYELSLVRESFFVIVICFYNSRIMNKHRPIFASSYFRYCAFILLCAHSIPESRIKLLA